MSFYRLSCVFILTLSSVAHGFRDEYDYVVVGAGSAGAVVANRLSKDPENHVLLLEAGGYPPLISEVPGFPAHLQLTDYDWQYKSVPQTKSCKGLVEERMNWPRGKVLGGSSILNYMVYVRGNKRDFDKWAEDGATGWSYQEVLPYFKKSEGILIPSVDKDYHGSGGELTVEHGLFKTPLVDSYLKAGEEMGYKVGDYNGESQNVFSRIQMTSRNGRRCSTAKAFLDPIQRRRNLNIVTSAFAKKIHFDDHKHARRITFDHGNRTHTVNIRREIILSAGSISSPQLLMLSGIGPKDHLEALKIPVISDLPVGENLQDHIFTLAMAFVVDHPYSLLSSRLTIDDIIDHLRGKSGPLNTAGGAEVLGFVNTKYNEIEDWPDVELMLFSFSMASDEGTIIKKVMGLKDEVFDKYYKPYVNKDTITCSPIVQRTKSKGRITLHSADPYDHPIIDPKYLSDPHDLKILIEGMKICLEWASTKAMKNLGTRPLDTVFPGCEKHTKFSDEYLECIARSMTQTVYHPLGTCKMGKPSCKHTVVDPSLRVKGVHGLRVADASVMPTMISANTNAASIMIGEKAADLILKDHKKKTTNDEL